MLGRLLNIFKKTKTEEQEDKERVELLEKIGIDKQAKYTLWIICFAAASLITYLSIIGAAGDVGRILDSILKVVLGKMRFIISILFFIATIILIKVQRREYEEEDLDGRLLFGSIIMLICVCGIWNIFLDVKIGNPASSEIGGGLAGFIIYPFLFGIFGRIGGFVMAACCLLFGFFVFSQNTPYEFVENISKTRKSPGQFWEMIPDVVEFWRNQTKIEEQEEEQNKIQLKSLMNKQTKALEKTSKKEKEYTKEQEMFDKLSNENKKKIKNNPTSKDFEDEFDNNDDDKQVSIFENIRKKHLDTWTLPHLEFLNETKGQSEPGDVDLNKVIIQDTLSSFGVKVDMKDVVVGPTVSQYTLKPSIGVKLSAIDNLQPNLALELASKSIRIESPIAGKSLVGIEIPNQVKSEVRLKEILSSKDFKEFKGDLPIAIGKDVEGKNLLYSMVKMPHLLVAGATGSGKSVWINNMLLSFLYKYSPQDLQLILVDMKRVELKLYDGTPHLLAPVITDAQKAINALKWAVLEMERRYKLLEKWGKRNIKDYNVFAENYNNTEEAPVLPYTVFVIDELGDLMMLAKSEVEPMIVRLTQMSRAVGIHLVLGTQRPDTQVVTGLIKANVPTRIAFAVASQIDSRVIIDLGGAEKLLGQGDGLLMSPSNMKPVRFQGAFVEESEVVRCVKFIKKQVEGNEELINLDKTVTEAPRSKLNVPGLKSKGTDDFEDSVVDDVYEKAKEIAFQKSYISVSMLQTALGIGYPRARKFVNMMEEEGLVGPPNGSKPREVFPPDDWEITNM